MAAVSVGGLVIPDLYQDNPHVTAAWFGNDLVTLVVAVPLLALSAATASAAVQMDAPEDLGQVGLWAFIGVGNLIASLLLLGRMRSAQGE